MIRFDLSSRSLVTFVLTSFLTGAFACANDPNDSDGSLPLPSAECSKDSECKGGRVCESGKCVDGGNQAPSGPSPVGKGGKSGTGGTGGGNDAPVCQGAGESCTKTGQCCQEGDGIGADGAICISNDGLCHAACASNGECKSGCCASVEGSSLGVCAAASACSTLGAPGDACNSGKDCDQNDSTKAPYGQVCLSNDDTCHAICTDSDQCGSSCCIALSGVSYGACGAYHSGVTCL